MIRAAFLFGAVLFVSACGSASNSTGGATRSTATTTVPAVVATEPTTNVAPEEAVTPEDQGPEETAWSGADAERAVENFLAALGAGAYEQAAWSAENGSIVVDGQAGGETVAEAFERMCGESKCLGPYSVVADGPGLIDPRTAQASSTVTVTHTASGEQTSIRLGTFEGQRFITDLPPLVPSSGALALVEVLFGGDPPERVVVQRFNAFETWENGERQWTTNWWSDDTYQVEGGFALTAEGLATTLDDPGTVFEANCAVLMTRGDQVLVFEQCSLDGWQLSVLTTRGERQAPIAFEEREEGEFVWFVERDHAMLSGLGDAEGNLTSIVTRSGVDLLGNDYASRITLSTDGTLAAYIDHADPAAYSHFWSPVVVVKDVQTGAEIGRWTLDNAVMCLEFAGQWLIACESDGDLIDNDPEQRALVAINIETGTLNRIETRVRVFLPA